MPGINMPEILKQLQRQEDVPGIGTGRLSAIDLLTDISCDLGSALFGFSSAVRQIDNWVVGCSRKVFLEVKDSLPFLLSSN